MNAQQLKNSILQEAIEGRLVPQDPNDEPASVLLDKIRAEKKRLVKEGKLIKKDLEEKPISEDEKPFEIPKSWEWVRISTYTNKVTDFVASGSFASLRENVKYYNNKEYAILVRTKDFQTNFKSELVYTDKHGYEFLENSNLFGGELILPNIGASIGKVFIVPKLDYRMTLAPNTIMIRFVEDYQRDWVYILFLSKFGKNLLYDISSSTAQGKFNKTDFKELVIPLPPLAEQKRIVAKIEELLPKVEEYGKAQEALDKLNEELPERLKKSILQEAIEGHLVPQDPNDEPASVLLDKIRKEKAKLVKEGKLKKKDLEILTISEDEIKYALPTGWIWSKLSFITSLLDGEKRDGDYVCLDAKYLRGKSSGDFLSKGKFVKKGDNIILVDGENSGEVFTVPCDGYMGSTFKQLWVSESMYLPYVLHFIRFYKDILRNSKRGAAIPHLNKDIFNNLVVGIPPLTEQKRIVAKIEQLMKEIDKLKNNG